MAPQKLLQQDKSSTDIVESDETFISVRGVSLCMKLIGNAPSPGEWLILAIFNGQVVLEGKWLNGGVYENEALPLNLKEEYSQRLVADRPLILILRIAGGKGVKDLDPLLNIDNRAGATIDLFPLVLGEQKIFTEIHLLSISAGKTVGCSVEVKIISNGVSECTKIPLIITMISGQCFPMTREGTVFLSAIGLDGICDPLSINFGMSLSLPSANKVLWASASNAGIAANSAFNIPNDDIYVPHDLIPDYNTNCRSFYWYAMKRLLVDPIQLKSRLETTFVIEIAGVPKIGKIDVRGRYMGFVDAGVLLEPGQYTVTTSTKLSPYNEADLPTGVGALLDLPPTSAKISARESDCITDEYGHSAYIVIRFDLTEALVPKKKLISLYEELGFSPADRSLTPINDFEIAPLVEDSIDIRRIRKEGGALAVHKELSGLACRGAVPMNQGIKRTAANRLLIRVRTMLKQFSPKDCSYIEWQDIVTAQHAASRRAVTASFAPQPPPPRTANRATAARCRMAGDTRVADIYVDTNFKTQPGDPCALLAKALQCLEDRNDLSAINYLLEALNIQSRNRYLLWTYGGQEFDKGENGAKAASAAFKIAVKGDHSDGITNAVGWAALHALSHYKNNLYAAFIASKKMRKAFELSREWHTFLERWVEASGEEECFWLPHVVDSQNPMLIAAAFFLCLRCYKFTERLLQCVETECFSRGYRLNIKTRVNADIYYLRAASLLLRRYIDKAVQMVEKGIKTFGPSATMLQMRASCLVVARGWDELCEEALIESEHAGSAPCPALLLRAAMGGMKTSPKTALQRAARAHKIAPSGHTALVIGRIYKILGEVTLGERWAASAVKIEPLLADGWALLALLAMYERNLNKARTMLRTARQVGPICNEIEEEITNAMQIVRLETLSDTLAKDLCLCNYY